MVIKQIKDKVLVVEFLEKHKRWSCETFSCLDSTIFGVALWYGVLENEELVALSMSIDALDPVPFFCIADLNIFEKLLCAVGCFARIHTEIALEHKEIFERYYQCSALYEMEQMVLLKDNFDFGQAGEGAEKLTTSDVEQINSLLKSYLAEELDKSVIANGIFYGVFKNGQLVAMAGTHNMSPDFKIGTMGFVVTKQEYRRNNLSFVCCLNVLKDMLAVCDEVIIKVDQEALGAIALYEKLGFKKKCKFLEIFADRRIKQNG